VRLMDLLELAGFMENKTTHQLFCFQGTNAPLKKKQYKHPTLMRRHQSVYNPEKQVISEKRASTQNEGSFAPQLGQ